MPEMKMLYINITLDIFIIIMFRYLNKYINHRVCFPFFKIKFQLIFLSEIWRLHKIVIYGLYGSSKIHAITRIFARSFVDLEKQQKRIRKIGLLKRNLNKCKFLY